MYLYAHRYSYRLPVRKGPRMLLPSAPRQVPRFLQLLSSLDAKSFQIFRWKYFCWIAESFEHMFGNAQRWSELSSVLHILLNAMGASFCYIGLTELTEKGSWLLLRATVISYLFRKYWRAGNIFFSPSLNSKQLMWVTTTPHFWGFLLGPVNRIGFINYHGKAAGEEIQMD